MGSIVLFVYGSLKRGFRHHAELDGAVFLRSASTESGYHLRMVGAYPALVRAEGGGSVQGELYGVRHEHLGRLDVFEGCPDLYQRATILLTDGTAAEAYVMSPSATAGAPILD